MNLGKTSAIFGTGVGIYDILRNRGRGKHPETVKAPQATQGQRDGSKSRFSLDKFVARINGTHDGLWQANRYCVKIFPKDPTLPWWMELFRQIGGDIEDLTFMCNSASLPGVQVITSDHRRQNYGTFDRRPFGVMVTDIPLTFMCDNKGFVLNLFNAWTKNIINYGNPNNDEHARNGSNQGLFEVAYRDNYLCKIEIHTYDQTQKEIQTYHLYEAFPMQVGDVTTAWSESDQFAVLPVQITFRTYNIERKKVVEDAQWDGYGSRQN